jgi:hypothetical protein
METFKTWIIAILLAIILFAGIFMKFESEYKKTIDDLKDRNEILQSANRQIDRRLDSLRIEYSNLQKRDSSLFIEIKQREFLISEAVLSAKKSRMELEKIRLEMISTRKKIEDFRKNPSNRTGDDLLNSIKLKTQ